MNNFYNIPIKSYHHKSLNISKRSQETSLYMINEIKRISKKKTPKKQVGVEVKRVMIKKIIKSNYFQNSENTRQRESKSGTIKRGWNNLYQTLSDSKNARMTATMKKILEYKKCVTSMNLTTTLMKLNFPTKRSELLEKLH